VNVAAAQRLVELEGAAVPAGAMTLEEIVRPFGETNKGITVLDGGRRQTLSYAELAGRAAAVATALSASGVRPADRVAATLDNDLDSVLLLMAVWAAGAAFVSVPRFSRRDAGQLGDRFGKVLRSCGCGFAVAGEPASGWAAGAGIRVIPAASLRGLPARVGRAADAKLGDTALIQFTSGSVSAPKGVAIGSRTLARHIHVLRLESGTRYATDRFVSWLPLYHDMGLLAVFMNALASRADLVLMPSASFAFGPSRWVSTLAREHGTMTAAPDFAFRMAAAVPYDAGLDLSGLRLAMSGGERVGWRALRDFHRATAPLGMRWEALSTSYGLAENVAGVTRAASPVLGPGNHVSVGRPLAGVSVRAPEGLPAGPVHIRGEFLFDGYCTADGFVPAPAGGWYDTGDDGFVFGGQLYVIGRRAEVASVAGRNVFAEDIEAVIRDIEGSDVGPCAAFRLDEAGQQFALMIEAAPRTPRTPDTLAALGARARATVTEAIGVRLATVLVVRAGTIPRTTSGKVQRAQCRVLHTRGLGRRLLAAVN
jgi:acyl-CoA synthetase (AMP-forming)/AMP-acid ligase II